jgi:ribose transport system substrate-binding protein
MQQMYEGYTGNEANLPTSYPEPTKKAKFVIGWQNSLGAQEVLAVEQKAAEAEVKRLGGKLIALDDQATPDKQASNFQQLMAQGVDGIFFSPFDPQAMEKLVEQAKKKGIAVVARDRTNNLTDSPGQIDSQFWQGRDHNAYSQIKYVSTVKPGAKIGLIGFAVPVKNIEYLIERDKYWAQKMGLQVVAETKSKSDDAAGGEQAMQGFLSKNLDAVVCYTDTVCSGAHAAARQAGQKPITVGIGGGSNGYSGVKNGTLTATPQFDVVRDGASVVDALYDKIADPNANIPKIVLIAPNQWITKDTLGSLQTWDDELAALKAKPSP